MAKNIDIDVNSAESISAFAEVIRAFAELAKVLDESSGAVQIIMTIIILSLILGAFTVIIITILSWKEVKNKELEAKKYHSKSNKI